MRKILVFYKPSAFWFENANPWKRNPFLQFIVYSTGFYTKDFPSQYNPNVFHFNIGTLVIFWGEAWLSPAMVTYNITHLHYFLLQLSN